MEKDNSAPTRQIASEFQQYKDAFAGANNIQAVLNGSNTLYTGASLGAMQFDANSLGLK